MSSEPVGRPALLRGLRVWFGSGPRPHGEALDDRRVGFIELFYDLVFVVLVGQAAHTLAVHPTVRGVLEFAAVFGLVWIAWINGTLYHELHGREDGRSRIYIFAQMGVLAVLAVMTGYAGSTDGTAFALTYCVLLLLLSWQWLEVRLRDDPAQRGASAVYLLGLIVTIVVMASTAWLDDLQRSLVWALVVVGWVVLGVWTFVDGRRGVMYFRATDSVIERFALFVIIVLGETVVGVVNGISESDRDALTVTTGVLALAIGFGIWWNYFDIQGMRGPRQARGRAATWFFCHLPQSGAIAAVGAAMVGLVANAHAGRTPAGVAWLLGGAVALGLVLIAVQETALEPAWRDPDRGRTVVRTYLVGAVAALAVAAAAPTPWLMAVLLCLVLSVTWVVAFIPTVAVRADTREPL